MGVMPAGMHDARIIRAIGDITFFIDWQGIDIRP
jgi:hypothetical protein